MTGRKYPQVGDEVITPVMTGYKMRCCDCDLVHKIDFVAVEIIDPATGEYVELDKEKYRVALTVSRDNRATGSSRGWWFRNEKSEKRLRFTQDIEVVLTREKEEEVK